MKATELRIGNYYNSHGAFKKVTPNTIEELFESENRTWIQPIQLTEEILLKCGFKKDGNFYHFKAFAIYVKWTNQHLCFRHWINAFDVVYLHQLQNLFFALMREELEINL